VATIVVARWEGEIDLDRARATLGRQRSTHARDPAAAPQSAEP